MVEAHFLLLTRLADRLKQSDRAQSRDVPGVFGYVERHAYMALGPEMVDLLWAHVVDQLNESYRI